MKELSIGIIGGGRVTKIMLHGWKRAGRFPASIAVTDTNADVLEKLKLEFPNIKTAVNDAAMPAVCDIVFIGLHPPVIAELLKEIKPHIKPATIIVSLAPKIPIAKISDGLDGVKNIARVIPNAPSFVNQGYNPVAFSPFISPEAKQGVLGLFHPLGEIPEVQEDLLEAYAIFTAMGPTYFWFQLFELQNLVASFGISSASIEDGLPKMINGAVKTMFASGLSPAEVMDLIPVKPLAEEESSIRSFYQNRLTSLYKKLKG